MYSKGTRVVDAAIHENYVPEGAGRDSARSCVRNLDVDATQISTSAEAESSADVSYPGVFAVCFGARSEPESMARVIIDQHSLKE